MEGGFKELKKYIKEVESGEREIEHLWFFYVPKVMHKFLMWSDTENWTKSSIYMKLLNKIIFILIYLLWILVILRILQDWNDLPVSRIVEGFSIAMGAHLAFVSFVILNNHRNLLTNTLQVLDQKYLAIPKDCEMWPRLKSFYVLEIKILLSSIFYAVAVSFPIIGFAIYSGKMPFDTIIPLGTDSYTMEWWFQFIYQGADCFFSAAFFSIKEYLLIGPFFYLVQLIRIEKAKILNLCSGSEFDPKLETRKLRNILMEMDSLLVLAEQMKKIVSMYLFQLINLSFLTISLGCVSILIESKEIGILQAVAKESFHPCYIISLTFCWTLMGEYFSEGIEDFRNSLYNCNCMDAPLEMKKLVLMYQLRLKRPNFIRGGPFFTANLQLFSEILKRTYYVLTVLIDFLA